MAIRTKAIRNEAALYAKQHKATERQLLPRFRNALLRSIQPLIDYVELYGTVNIPVGSLVNTKVWSNVYQTAFEQIGLSYARREYYYQRRIDTGLDTKASAIDVFIDVWTSLLRNYALQYTYNISQKLNQTTIDIINRVLDETNSLGLDRDGAIRLFIKDITGRMRRRSLRISRTEATTISNLGKEIGARQWIEQQGGQGRKAWITRMDGKERHSHREVNGDIVLIDDEYTVGLEFADMPGDTKLSAAEKINCRCTQTFISEARYNYLLRRNRIADGKIK